METSGNKENPVRHVAQWENKIPKYVFTVKLYLKPFVDLLILLVWASCLNVLCSPWKYDWCPQRPDDGIRFPRTGTTRMVVSKHADVGDQI